MFNALNRFISRLDGDPQAQKESSEQGSFGFQVLRNTDKNLAIEPWFDFVIGINSRMIDNPDPNLFAQEIRNCAGGTVILGLWSAKGQRTRAMHIPVPADTATLGLSLQWTPIATTSNIWHVLDVPANSPADTAGLLPFGDYILGSPEGALHGESGLSELVEDHIGRPLALYVYNNEYNVTREVTITPSRDWGGSGALGCVLGYGALHRLPAPLDEPVSAPGETMFDGDSEKRAMAFEASSPAQAASGAAPPPPSEGDFLVPAQMVAAPAAGPPVGRPPRGKKKEKHHGHSPNKAMDDYFAEQEKKSRELDNAPSGRATPVAAPPKGGPPVGGPPKGGPPSTATPQADKDGGETEE